MLGMKYYTISVINQPQTKYTEKPMAHFYGHVYSSWPHLFYSIFTKNYLFRFKFICLNCKLHIHTPWKNIIFAVHCDIYKKISKHFRGMKHGRHAFLLRNPVIIWLAPNFRKTMSRADCYCNFTFTQKVQLQFKTNYAVITQIFQTIWKFMCQGGQLLWMANYCVTTILWKKKKKKKI